MKFNSIFFILLGSVMMSASAMTLALSLHLQTSQELILEWEVYSGSLKIPFIILLDFMSTMFLSTVLMISSAVFFYSSSYMEPDKFNSRFAMIVFSFVVSMCLMITSPSLVSILLGWDGLGVTSYLLVCYYSSNKSFNASMLTALTNRLGDVAILLTIAIWMSSGMFNFSVLSSTCTKEATVALTLLVMASMTKSAQIPLSAWLPAAMAAPTPVSALVHSSTLVTAGVYLLIRFNYLITEAGASLPLLILGLMTTFMAGSAALFELDMKKVIALSTLSQLGMMFFSLGISFPFLAFFHLVSHAYFKAMLFMAAGAMIHSVKDYQDFRKMGSSISSTKFLSAVMFTANLSLCGLPFMSGFYSKDLVLEMTMTTGMNPTLYGIMIIATLLTLLYSLRFTIFLMWSPSTREPLSQEVDVNSLMKAGMSILLAPSIAGGFWLSGLMPSPTSIILPTMEKMLILILLLTSSLKILIAPLFNPKKSALFSSLSYMWFMPNLFSPTSTNHVLTNSKKWLLTTDMAWVPYVTWNWMVNFSSSNFYTNSILRSAFFSSLIMVPTLMMVI